MFVTTEIFATFYQACQVEKRKSVLIYTYVLLFTWLCHTVIPPFSVFYDFDLSLQCASYYSKNYINITYKSQWPLINVSFIPFDTEQ